MSERPRNTSFSLQLPSMQLAWDSVSLGALKFCARYYQLAIIEGYEARGDSPARMPRESRVHLDFGIWLHQGRERYYHARARGESHNEGVKIALHHIMCVTWNRELKRGWISEDANKNRFTLARSIVWLLDQYEHDSMETILLANGKPAVELSFSFETSYRTQGGETIVLCGHLDRLALFNGIPYVDDAKSTKSTLSSFYFESFSPDNQFSLYSYAGKVVYALPVQGIVVTGVQVAVDFTRATRGMVQRTSEQLDEWYGDLRWWFGMAEAYARAKYWPMNDRNCWRCSFQRICAMSPSVRSKWLESDYSRRVWDPLQRRGDV